eukprot:TRINITY_DN4766_c0_g1_i1.p1 TRINITY_DN4766_c0_g1~~TRINITY_DN4766_c0_g1_i1.p1  ORF type:complete len:331 (+),score=112.34 TRINITY_DN4766_c0_g1_i1:29-1021(+)
MGASESREQKISALALTAAKRLVEHCEKGLVKVDPNGHSPDAVKYEFTHAGFKFLEALEKHPDELDKLYGIIVDEDDEPLNNFTSLENGCVSGLPCPKCGEHIIFETNGIVVRSKNPCSNPTMKAYKLKLNVPSGKLVVAPSEVVHKAFPFTVEDATGKDKQLISFPSLLGNQVRSKLHNKKTNIVDITVADDCDVWMEDGDLFIGKFKGSQSTTPAAEENGNDSDAPASASSTPGKRKLSTPKTYTPRKRAKTSAGGLLANIKSGGKISLCDYTEFNKLYKGEKVTTVDVPKGLYEVTQSYELFLANDDEEARNDRFTPGTVYTKIVSK